MPYPGSHVLVGLACLLAASCADSDAPERSRAAYCEELNRQRPRLQPAPDRALDLVYADAAQAFDRAEPLAPGEIRRDVEAVTKLVRQLAQLTAEADEGPGQVDNRRLGEVALANKAANDRVTAYNKQHCGVDTAAATTP